MRITLCYAHFFIDSFRFFLYNLIKRLNKRLIERGGRKMKKSYRIENIDCAHCAEELQNSLKKIEGVIELKINFLLQKLIVEASSETFEIVMAKIREQVKKSEPDVVIKG